MRAVLALLLFASGLPACRPPEVAAPEAGADLQERVAQRRQVQARDAEDQATSIKLSKREVAQVRAELECAAKHHPEGAERDELVARIHERWAVDGDWVAMLERTLSDEPDKARKVQELTRETAGQLCPGGKLGADALAALASPAEGRRVERDDPAQEAEAPEAKPGEPPGQDEVVGGQEEASGTQPEEVGREPEPE